MEPRRPSAPPACTPPTSVVQGLLHTTDWSATALGPVDGWPACVRSALDIVLHARQPMAVVWGPHLHILYNDSFRTLPGARAEDAATFGQPIAILWPEIAGKVVPLLQRALAGHAAYIEDARVNVTRNGVAEDLFLTVSTSPIVDAAGVVAGVFCTFADTTARVAARRERDATPGITGGEQPEAAARQSAQDAAAALDANVKYRTFFTQGSHFAMLLDTAGRVLEVNLVTLEASGYRRDQVVGRLAWECGWWAAAPATVRILQDAVAQAQAGQAAHNKLPYHTVAGEERIGQVAIAPVCDDAGRVIYLAATGTDITEREGVEARLRLLDAIGETTRQAIAPDAIMESATRMLGEYLHVTRVAYADVEADNDRFTIRADWTAPGAFSTVGVYSLDLFGARAQAAMRGGRTLLIEDLDAEMTAEEGATMFDRIGVKAIICCPLVKEGKLVAMMAVHQDAPRAWRPGEVALVEAVVERCWAHIERVRAMETLRETDRRKSEFLAVLAHELRNPLAPIRNGIDMLRLSANNPVAAAKVRDMMERQVAHMVHLINDLLDVARVNNGKVVLQVAPVDLRQVLGNAVEASAAAMEAARHAITVDVPAEPVIFDADPVRLAQVLGNLLSNAVKYTPPGGVLHLSGQRRGDMIEIRLQDNGIGIPPEHLASVFDMFTQVSRNLERARGGLGIGLSLVQRLVALHGGTVSAASPGLGLGSTFTVRLPAPAAVAMVTAGGAPPGSVDEPGGAAPLRVLVADDNVDAAEIMCALLEASGYVTRIAYDGAAALEVAAQFLPQVALLDLGMPRLDGFEAARRMRALPGLDNMVLVAVTGWGAESDRARTRDAGFDHHLLKPASMEQVQEIIAAAQRRLAAPRG
jgi:PAS domain S-box-containing protein